MRQISPDLYDNVEREIKVIVATYRYNQSPAEQKTWSKLQCATEEFLKHNAVDASKLNERAWFVYENYKKFNDNNALKSALEWVKKAVELSPDFHEAIDTYAQISFDLGNKKEAIRLEKKALEIAIKKNDVESAKSYTKTLENFQK